MGGFGLVRITSTRNALITYEAMNFVAFLLYMGLNKELVTSTKEEDGIYSQKGKLLQLKLEKLFL